MANIQTRVLNILKEPNTEWPVIAAEATDVGRLYKEYIIPLSLIPPLASFIGLNLLSSILPFGGLLRMGLGLGLVFMVATWVLGLVGIYIDALVIEWLAPKFKSSGTRVDALKIVAYSMTAGWVFGILNIIPLLGILAVLGSIYGIYLCYLGLPHVMKTPADQVVIYMIVSAVVIIVVNVVISMILGALFIGGALTTAAAL